MITCYYYRGIIKRSLDADKTLPHRASNHIQKCPGCRKVHESETRVIRELRAASNTLEQSPFLHARIMSSIARCGPVAKSKPAWSSSIWAVGLATACLLLLAVLWAHQRPMPSHEVVAHPSQPAPLPMELSLSVKLPDGNQLRQWTEKLDEPLETEMKLVVGDAKTAFNSLAENFLPEKVRHSLLEQDKGS